MNEMNKLVDVIEREAAIVDSLLNVMKRKQEAIIALTLENIKSSVSEEIKLVSMTKSLERERLDLIKQIMPSDSNPDNITLTQLISNSNAAEGSRLLNLKDKLHKTLDDLKNINETNMLLIERSKKFIKENISIMTQNGNRQLVNTKI
jgi:flagellar biosynthesis/type III secretory pathway chaperone